MIRALVLALWGVIASLSSSYAVVYWKLHQEAPAKTEDGAQGIEQKKTRVINVPIIAKGQVQGYVVAQFIYVAESKALKALSAPPDAIILDEAFRMIYAEEKVDFTKLQKADLSRLTGTLKSNVATRLKSDLVRDILVQEFNYVSKDEVRK